MSETKEYDDNEPCYFQKINRADADLCKDMPCKCQRKPNKKVSSPLMQKNIEKQERAKKTGWRGTNTRSDFEL